MKKILLALLTFVVLYSSTNAQIISQYIETSSGTSPKGIEIWNNTASTLDFSTSNLVIEKGTNGGIPSVDYTLSSGTLIAGDVLVMGTSDMDTTTTGNGASFYVKSFTFNGDDALVIKYGGTITDVFGTPGSDPGSSWTGSSVSTYNSSISLLSGITTGDTDGWTDPSERFETTTTNNSLTGFGIAPSVAGSPLITVSTSTLTNLNYTISNGPSASQSFTVSGADLTNDITITAPVNYEFSTDDITFQNTDITLTHTAGVVVDTTIYVQLEGGLATGVYNSQDITLSSTGATTKTVTCSGSVVGPQTTTLPYTQNFDSGFGTVNLFDDGGDDYWMISSGSAACNGYPNDDAIDEDWMILPAIDFSAYTAVEISFDLWWKYNNQDSNNFLKLMYSSDYDGYGDPSTATWNKLSFTSPATAETWTTTGPIDLSAFSASNTRFAFYYKSDDVAGYWQVDNISIKEATAPVILPNAWINEIHYDNTGADVDKMVEVILKDAELYTLSDFTISMYNGGDGKVYNTPLTLNAFTIGDTDGEYTIYSHIYPVNGLQNGPDGIALDYQGNVIQFLSYEGSFTATDGPANGITSNIISVIEDGTEAVGNSLQLIGTGLEYSDFVWIDPLASPGTLNSGQLLAPPAPPVPVDWRYIFLTFLLISGMIIYRKLK